MVSFFFSVNSLHGVKLVLSVKVVE